MTNKIPIYNKENEIINYFIVDQEDYYEINKINWVSTVDIKYTQIIFYTIF
jgi:hypothetical protein